MSAVADQIVLRDAKRQTVCKRAYAPRPYCLSDPDSVNAATKEPKAEQTEFLKECFLIERDVPVLILALKKASRVADKLATALVLADGAQSEGQACVMIGEVKDDAYLATKKTWEEYVADAWDEIEVSPELRRVMDEHNEKEIKASLGSGEVDGQLPIEFKGKDMSGKTIDDIKTEDQACGGPVTVTKIDAKCDDCDKIFDQDETRSLIKGSELCMPCADKFFESGDAVVDQMIEPCPPDCPEEHDVIPMDRKSRKKK